MNWKCPHCGIGLSLSDDKIGTSWCFSKCFKCGGFALVKRSDPKQVKVQKAPAGEKILLPHAPGEKPREEKKALQPKPVQQWAPPQTALKPLPPRFVSEAKADAPKAPEPVKAAVEVPAAAKPILAVAAKSIPAPLPEVAKRRGNLLSTAIAGSAVAVIASGVYLLLQGQRLMKEAEKQSQRVVVEQKTPPAPPAPIEPQVIDPVKQNAVAIAPAPEPKEPQQKPVEPAIVLKPDPAEAVAEVVATSTPEEDEEPAWRVQVAGQKVSLRAGPGLNYPVLGVANPELDYVVAGWKNEWFKLENPEAKPDAPRTVWIRNDLVKPTESVSLNQ